LLRLLFSHDAAADFERLYGAICVLDRHLNLVEQASFLAPRWVPSPKSRRASLARRTIDEAVFGYIAGRRRASAAPDDLLSLMLEATHPDTGGRMDDGQIRDEIVTLLMGDRITAPTLLWTWWLLAGHPAVEERVRREVADVLEGRPATAADVPNLRYGASVLAEVLRLYPSAWLTARVPVSDDTLGNYRIPAGTRVVVCPYITQRHPRYWRDPESFDPDRFYAGPDADRPHYAYFPFGGGPRNCIASTFAAVEAQVIVAAVLQECRLRAVPGTTVRVSANPLLMPTPVPLMTVEWAPAVAVAGRDAPMRTHGCPFAHA
jgi:cytochrome P450